MSYPSYLPHAIVALLEREIPAQPKGFVVSALCCGFCPAKDRVELWRTPTYVQVEDWCRRHRGCEAQARVDAIEIQVPCTDDHDW